MQIMPKYQIWTIREHREQLRIKSQPVLHFNAQLRTLIHEMFEVMYAAPGIGLAAVQIGIHQRVITMDVTKKDEPPERRVFINPEIAWSSSEVSSYEEGCLSIPEFYDQVARPASVRVKFQDDYGRYSEIQADSLFATCLQHEIDHLEGKLFIDRLSKVKRDMVIRKFNKAGKRGEFPSFAKDEEPSHHIG